MNAHDNSTLTPQLPLPPVSAEVDLRRYPTLPLDVQRMRDSAFVALATAEEFRAGLLLLCAAWHQVPAGSLPSDDRLLCSLVRVERKKWMRIKQRALHGFVKHSDGRLYHPVLIETVKRSWASMQAQKQRTAAATAAKKDRYGQRDEEHNDDRNDHQRKGNKRNISSVPTFFRGERADLIRNLGLNFSRAA